MQETFKISEDTLESILDKNSNPSQRDNLIEIMKAGAIVIITDSNNVPISLLKLDENYRLTTSEIANIQSYNLSRE